MTRIRNRVPLYEAGWDPMIKRMAQQYPQLVDTMRWAVNTLRRQDRIIWYLRYLEKNPQMHNARDLDTFQQNLDHFFLQDIPGIDAIVWGPNDEWTKIYQELVAAEKKHQENQERNKPAATQPGDQVIERFSNGNYWIRLDRAYCKEEGRSGRHCGNVAGQQKKDQRILSLRNPQGQVILTFILEPDGKLGEMKAVGNQKPRPQYFPEIMRLLLNPMIKGIQGQGALPDMNFSVFDLDEQNLRIIAEQRPSFILDQCRVTPAGIITAPDWLKQTPEYRDAALKARPALYPLLRDNPTHQDWKHSIALDPRMIAYAPDDYPDYEKLLIDALVADTSLNTNIMSVVRKKYRTDFNFLKKLLSKVGDYIYYINPLHRDYAKLARIAAVEGNAYLGNIDQSIRTGDFLRDVIKSNPQQILRSGSMLQPLINEETVLDNLDNPKILRHIAIIIKRDFLTPELKNLLIAADPGTAVELDERGATPSKASALIAVRNNGRLLEYMGINKKDPRIVKAAVENTGLALKHVPLDMRTPELCELAVKNTGLALRFVPPSLRTPELVKRAIRRSPRAVIYAPRDQQTAAQYMKMAVADYRDARRIPSEYLSPEFVRVLAQKNPRAVLLIRHGAWNRNPDGSENYQLADELIPPIVKANPDTVRGILASRKLVSQPVGEELYNWIFLNHPQSYYPGRYSENPDRDQVLEIVTRNPGIHVPYSYWGDVEVLARALRRTPHKERRNRMRADENLWMQVNSRIYELQQQGLR